MIDDEFIIALRERGEHEAAEALLDAWKGAERIVAALPFRPDIARKTALYWLRRLRSSL